MRRLYLAFIAALIGGFLGPMVAFFPFIIIPHVLAMAYMLGFWKALVGGAIFGYALASLPGYKMAWLLGLSHPQRVGVIAVPGAVLGVLVSGVGNAIRSGEIFKEGFAFLLSAWAGATIALLIWTMTRRSFAESNANENTNQRESSCNS